jgi:hypothetical protein
MSIYISHISIYIYICMYIYIYMYNSADIDIHRWTFKERASDSLTCCAEPYDTTTKHRDMFTITMAC